MFVANNMGVSMKKLLFLLIILSLSIYFGCSTNLVSPSLTNTSQTGQVALKISSDSIPSNVVKITAILSQNGEDTLTTSADPLSGSSAELNFSNVPVGTWRLKVNAEDNNSLILYTGETDIQINAGEVTNVVLTLMPTGQGTGSIYIYVNWGQNNSDWVDYNKNPVITNSGSSYGINGIGNPRVIMENGLYKMWYKNLENNGISTISYAISNDGISWEKVGDGPVINLGEQGSWDAGAVTTGPIIKENGMYKMYYSGAVEAHKPWQIGLAISSDGINWEKYPNPVINSGDGWDYSIGADAIVKRDSIYYLYYRGWQPPLTYQEGLATSTDGINWTKYAGNPVLTPSENWEGTGAYYTSVIFENKEFKMLYMGTNAEFGKAISDDGIHWIKDSGNPYFSGSQTSNNWCSRPVYPYLIKVGNIYKVYYNSSVSTNNPQAIGFFTIKNF